MAIGQIAPVDGRRRPPVVDRSAAGAGYAPQSPSEDVYAIGVDLGGSHWSVARLDKAGNLYDFTEGKNNPTGPPEVTLNAIAESINKIAQRFHNICAVGIGMPGPLDIDSGTVLNPPNLPSWHGFKVTQYLKNATKLPVYLMNDVKAATLGEAEFGAGRGLDNFVMMAIGTGIGGGVVVNGKLVKGEEGSAGEIGHMSVDPKGEPCACGGTGCLENLAAAPIIAGRGAAAFLSPHPTRLKEMIHSIEDMSAKVVSQAAAEGDETSLGIIRSAGKSIGVGIANLAVALNPRRFIIGGGVAQSGKPLFDAIQEEADKRVGMIPSHRVEIVPAKLGMRAGITGAGANAFIQAGVEIA